MCPWGSMCELCMCKYVWVFGGVGVGICGLILGNGNIDRCFLFSKVFAFEYIYVC